MTLKLATWTSSWKWKLLQNETDVEYKLLVTLKAPCQTGHQYRNSLMFYLKNTAMMCFRKLLTVWLVWMIKMKNTRFYTGFPGHITLMLFFHIFMKHGADRPTYWKGQKRSLGDKRYNEIHIAKQGRNPIDE